MAINPISSHQGATGDKIFEANAKERKIIETKEYDADTKAAVFVKSSPQANKNKLYSKNSTAISGMSLKANAKLNGLKGVVEKLLTMQSVKTAEGKGLSYAQIFKKYNGNIKGYFENLRVDEATKLKAQQDIAQDGYWGVKQTSERIIEFAKGISGGDASKLAELKGAIEKGFAAAEKAWGGSLPAICMQTKEAVFKGLDEWAA